ncbi:MAG: DegV domain-containing protein [Smithella sp. PtaU1.Bin162]|nr:MAG: DegV domain-containing protein [Smithella sp. PtaU1.Bin162]
MDELLKKSFTAGVERVAAWADLLDSINVFPVADGDTGRNLSISLMPLMSGKADQEMVIRELLLSARGNSGNIASRFFSAFYRAETRQNLYKCAEEGRKRAWRAVNDPRPGTMLSVFDVLVESWPSPTAGLDRKTIDSIMEHLEKTVQGTCAILPKLKDAGVVDAGALGMYIFFDGFFQTLAESEQEYRPVTELFKNHLHISSGFQENSEAGYCVDFVVEARNLSQSELANITRDQESVIVIPEGDLYKIHLHTDNIAKVRDEAAKFGSMVSWEDDNLREQIDEFKNAGFNKTLHIMTDAAGSLTRADAKKNGLTLLPSYLTIGVKSLPETNFHPRELYAAMKRGIKVSTSQASVFERHQFYESVTARFDRVMYLCVGSVYTGNFSTAAAWKKRHDWQNRLIIIDTGAASGRLALIVLATARFLNKTNDVEKTIVFAHRVLEVCEEYVFLDKLEYLAAGGRLSKTSAFFGDMLKMKPVISPQPEGAKKIGVVRNSDDQIKMARERLAASLAKDAKALIMLEYSDNYDLVAGKIKPLIAEDFPQAEIILQPLSLTSGAHMGPGTWAIAFLPEMKTEQDVSYWK